MLKDFVAVSGPLGVSHFLILTATERASYLRVCKTPRVRLHTPSPSCGIAAIVVKHTPTPKLSTCCMAHPQDAPGAHACAAASCGALWQRYACS